MLSHWVALAQGISSLPDWRLVALATAELFFFALLVEAHYRELERLLAARAHLPDFDLSFRRLLCISGAKCQLSGSDVAYPELQSIASVPDAGVDAVGLSRALPLEG